MDVVPGNMHLQFIPQVPKSVCRVCGLPAHGVHFGVTACRACAAFFRRFIVLNLEYDCLKDNIKCSLNKIRRSSCRHCRFQKCLQMGMTADNVQWNRDIYSNDLRFKKFKTKEIRNDENDESVAYPSTSHHIVNLYSVIKTEKQLYTKSIFSEFSSDNIEKEMSRLFVSDVPSIDHGYFASLNPLYKLVEGIRMVRHEQRTQDIRFENRLSMEILVPHWRQQAKNVAIIAMHTMAFRQFSLEEKLRIFKALWKNVYRFERIQMSTEVFGESCVCEKKLAISCERAIQLDSLCFDIEGVAEGKLNKTLQDYKIFAERCVDEVAKPLSRLKLSIEEVAFLITIFSLHNEDKIFGTSLGDVCDNFRDEISNHLHEFYKNNNIINYAPRISKMMSIIAAMKRIHTDELAGEFTTNTKNSEELD